TERPPHRSVRAAFPHTAPTSGPNGYCVPYAFQRLWHACPALSPARALLVCIPLGRPRPWLHRLRRVWLPAVGSAGGLSRFVRRLRSYYGVVRLLGSVHHRLRLLTFPMRAGNGNAVPVRPETSQLPMRSLCT